MVVIRLRELGVDAEPEDWDDLDDDDILGAIATHAIELGLEFEELCEAIGIPLENTGETS